MRPYTPKRAAWNRKAKAVRDELKAEVGRCELCHTRRELDDHEIARGTAGRAKALDQRCAVLVLCWRCHHIIHFGREPWPAAKQLALLKRSRPDDYDPVALCKLMGKSPTWITEADVDEWENE